MLWPGLVIDINTNVINLRLSCIVAKFAKQHVQSRKDQIDIIGHLFNLIFTIGKDQENIIVIGWPVSIQERLIRLHMLI